MTDPAPTMGDPNSIGAIPFWRSPQAIGLIATAVAAIAGLFLKSGPLTDPVIITAVLTAILPVVGLAVRVKSKVQPLTVTQKQADNHPATLAATTRTSTVITPPSS